MISKSDAYILLADLNDKGVDTKTILSELASSTTLPLSVIKFINDNRQLDLTQFFERLRKNYNNKKSSLYGNIVKDIDEPSKVLTTLSALLTQILLFADKAQDRQMFLRHARCNEITIVLNNYFKNYDLTNCIKLMRVIKADLKALENIK